MFHDTDHPNVSLPDWERFLKKPPSHLIAEVIDRSKTGLPDCFVPLARGVAIASDTLLLKAGHQHGMNRPRGWRKSIIHCDVFLWDIFPDRSQYLLVRQCDNKGLWTVERWSGKRPYEDSDEMLVHEFGATPIFTRSYPAAMRLAMYCHENGPPAGLRWIPACIPGYQNALDERRIDEIVARQNALREDDLRLE